MASMEPAAAELRAELFGANLAAQDTAEWRVWTTDLLTGRQLSYQLPIVIDSYSRAINDSGSFSGTVSLDAAEDPVPLLQPRRTALWVAKGDSLRWGGIVWPRQPDISARTMQISASSFFSYFSRRLISTSLTYTGVDRLDLIRSLIAYAQGAAGGNIGLLTDTTKAGILINQAYAGDEYKPIADAITDLAEVDPGCEFTEEYYLDSAGRPRAVLRLGAPSLGSDKGLLMQYPGNVVDYTWPDDPGSSVNSVTAVGSGEGSAMLRSTAIDSAELAAGYPLLESTTSYKDVAVQSVLDGHARSDLAAALGDKVTPQLTIRTSGDVQLGDWSLGDTVRVMLTSVFHRPQPGGGAGYDGRLRIVGDEVHPATSDQDESAVLSCDSIRTH